MQSINQSIKRSNQCMWQSTRAAINQSINQSINHSMGGIIHAINQPINAINQGQDQCNRVNQMLFNQLHLVNKSVNPDQPIQSMQINQLQSSQAIKSVNGKSNWCAKQSTESINRINANSFPAATDPMGRSNQPVPINHVQISQSNQPTNQPTNADQPTSSSVTNQLNRINQSNQLELQPINQIDQLDSINQSINRSIQVNQSKSINQSINQSVQLNQSMHTMQSEVNLSFNQISQTTSTFSMQRTNQAVNQATNQIHSSQSMQSVNPINQSNQRTTIGSNQPVQSMNQSIQINQFVQ